MNISKAIKKNNKKQRNKKSNKNPLWLGPQNESDMGGVTQSMLGQFIVDRERFRVRNIDGVTIQERFMHRIEYGNMWHLCEEHHARGDDWEEPLLEYRNILYDKHPLQQREIKKWWNVCSVQFPVYLKYWEKNKAGPKSVPLLQEKVFHIPYELPDGRIVWLRGKWDGVDLFKVNPRTYKKENGIWLTEHKSKGEVDEVKIQQQLRFDLQTMFYLVALEIFMERGGLVEMLMEANVKNIKLSGVHYNVIRRPLSGGEGSIRQHKPSKKNPKGETEEEFYKRLADNYLNRYPDRWFFRWPAEIYPADIDFFKTRFLNPILIQLCDWYDTVTGDGDPFEDMYGIHWIVPYGIFNPLLDDQVLDIDEYVMTGNEIGLRRVDRLFPELQD